MATRRIIFCSTGRDADRAAALAGSLEAAGFECRLTGDGGRDPEDFRWAGIMVVLLSDAANRSESVRRDVEEAANSGLRMVPVKLDGSSPSPALRYYLGPVQWLEPGEGHDFARRFADALEAGEGSSRGSGNARRSGRLWTGAALAVIAAAALALLRPGSGAARGGEMVPSSGNVDILLVGSGYQPTLPAYLASLGYSVDSAGSLPDPGALAGIDLVLLCAQGSPDLDLPLYDYVCAGGSVLLQAGQPWYMEMPAWVGMRTYSNYWGGDFPVTFTADSVLGVPGIRRGGTLIYYSTFADGAAVLKDPITASVDACFDGEDSLAAAVRNTVGSGRVAWLSGPPEPHADQRGNDYSTEGFESYLEALYAWLDRDGPEGAVR